MKRVFALVVCLCMVFAMVPAASAATGDVSLNGNAIYNTVEEALAAAKEGDTVTLNADVTAGQVIVPKDVTLDLGGYNLTANLVVAMNGVIYGGNVVVAEDMLKVIGDNDCNLAVWNGEGYSFASVDYRQMLNVAEDGSSAQYIFVPYMDAETTALLADGGADNGISVKVQLTWNGGSIVQYYTFSDELVSTVYGGNYAQVFVLNVTGIAGIEDMVISAVVESAAGGFARNADLPVVAPSEPEETEPVETKPELVENELVLTVDSLGLPSQSYSASTATVNGVGFEWIQLGNYGDGIQVRDKNGNTSMLWNTSAFGAGIKEIRLVYSATKDVTYANPDCAIYSFGNENGTYTYETKLSTEAGVKEYVITPDAETYTFFKLEHDLGYTQYWDSITIVYYGEAGDAPVEPSEPVETEPVETEPVETEPVETKPADPEADSTLSIADAIALGASKDHNTYTEGKYYVTGVITEVYNTTYGNMKITDDAGNILTIYGTYNADGTVRYDALEVKPVAGDTVTVYGIVGQYNSVAQIKNGWIVEHIAVEPEVTEPVETEPVETEPVETEPTGFQVVDAPVVGTAYKFGMIQKNVSETDVYYLNGNMSSYYMATTTDAGAAVDVYLEETEGGYYLYAMVNGAKQYINMVVSGTHVNGKYEDAPATVYTYSEDSKTVISVVNDADYWMGTRNDMTYTTVGPVKTSYNGFYMQFYAEVTTEPEAPVEPSEPVAGPSGSVEIESYGNAEWTAPQDGYVKFTINISGAKFAVLDGFTPVAEGVDSITAQVVAGTTYGVYPNYDVTEASVVTWEYVTAPEGGDEGGSGGDTEVVPSGEALGLGNNDVTLTYATMPMMAPYWTYTATENGYLTVTVESINGETNLGMAFGRGMYTLLVGQTDGMYTNTATVYMNAGESVEIRVLDTLDMTDVPAVLNLSFEAGSNEPVVEKNPADYFETNDSGNYIIGSLENPVDIFVGNDDIYYYYVAEGDGNVIVTAATEAMSANQWLFVNGTCYHSVSSVNVTTGDVVLVNVWSGYEGTVSFEAGEYIPTEPAEPEETEPALPGTEENPYVVDELPYNVYFWSGMDEYYSYTATEEGNIIISDLEGATLFLPWGDSYEKDENGNYVIPVIADYELMMNFCTFAEEIDGFMTITFQPAASEPEAAKEVVFELGADGDAAHKDGNTDTATYTETNGDYTLSIIGGTKMYPGAVDAQGNGCIKLGTSKVVGGFSFTVADDVTSVKIAIAKYKANATNVDINGITYALENASNDGAYDVIEIDTSSTKTITLTTVSGGVRAMVNSITFVIAG